MIILLSTSLLTCAAITGEGNIPIPDGVRTNYGEVTAAIPADNLAIGEVYVAKTATYTGQDTGDGTFDITLYFEISDCYVYDEAAEAFTNEPLPTLAEGSSVIFSYTLDPQFSFKGHSTLSPGAVFDVDTVSGVITWTVPDDQIQNSAQVTFTIALKENWELDTPYYTDLGVTATFTPAVGNRHYYGMTMEVVPAAFIVPGFNWNNSYRGFRDLKVKDTVLGLDINFVLDSPLTIGGYTYDWAGAETHPEDYNSGFHWGFYTVQGRNKIYHFWVKPDVASTVFGEDINYLYYPLAVPQNGGNTALAPGDKTIYYTHGQKDTTNFDWADDNVITNLPDKGYIELMDEAAYRIRYELGVGGVDPGNPRSYYPDSLPLEIRNPTRAGYKFLGWTVLYDNGDIVNAPPGFELPLGTMGDVTMIAIWDSIYNIDYILGGDDVTNGANNPVSYSKSTPDDERTINAPTRPGYDFSGWMVRYANGDLLFVSSHYTIPSDATGNIVFMANWKKQLTAYSIEYHLNAPDADLPPANPTSYTLGDLPLEIQDPTRTNYDFSGWIVTYTDGTVITADISTPGFTIIDGVEGDLVLAARWTSTVPDELTITYVLGQDGQNDPANPTEYTSKGKLLEIHNATRTGYKFSKWTITDSDGKTVDSSAISFVNGLTLIDDIVACDLVLTANWLPKYSIEYSLDGGRLNPGLNKGYPSEYVVEDLPLTIHNPVDDSINRDFLGWFVMIHDYTIAAFLHPDNGDRTENGYSTLSETMPGYVEGNLILIALWSSDTTTYHIRYLNLDDEVAYIAETNAPTTYTDASDPDNPITIPEPQKDGYLFLGWTVLYVDMVPGASEIWDATNGLYNLTSNAEGDVYLSARWAFLFDTSLYTITYVLGDPAVVNSYNPESYSGADLPLKIYAPSWTGHYFSEWTAQYEDATPLTLDIGTGADEGAHLIPTGTTGNLLLIAHWVTQYSITYDFGPDGGPVAGHEDDYPNTYATPDVPLIIPDPVRPSYDFIRWLVTYRNGAIVTSVEHDPAGFTKIDNVAADLFLTAVWSNTVAGEYTITYILGQGKHNTQYTPPTTYTVADLPLEIHDPYHDTLIFLDWTVTYFANGTEVTTTVYDSAADITTISGVEGDIVLTANWGSSYNIIGYNLNRGEPPVIANPTTYISQRTPIPLNDPSRTTYVFTGWTILHVSDNTLEVGMFFEIPQGITGDLLLTATWEPAQYNIIYQMNGGVNPSSNPLYYNVRDTFPISIVDPSLQDGTFLGWIITYANGTITSHTRSYEIPQGTTGDIHLSALWVFENVEPGKYWVTYYANWPVGNVGVGSAPMDDQSPYVSGSAVVVLDQNTLAKEGYAFLGWATNAAATVATHTVGSTFNIFSNTVLYAVWQSENTTVPYTVLYYLENTTSAIAANKTATGILGTSVTETAPTLSGYTAIVPTTITATLNDTNNEIIFYYTANSDIEYTVYYYRQSSTTQLANPKIVTNQTMGAPITETAIAISGYTAVAPTSVTITLNATGNVITFYYTVNSGSGNNGGNSGGSGSGSNSGSNGGSSNKPTPTVPPQAPQTEPTTTPTATPPPASGTEESEQVWALVNLILSVAGLILIIIIVIAALLQQKQKQKKNTAEQEQAQKAKQKNTQNYKSTEQGNETKEKEQKKRRDLWLLASIILGIAGIVVFVLTENWSLPMAWADRWTVVNAIIFVAQIIAILFVFKHVKKENNNTDDEKGANDNN
ncbi:InlB B-repeat-containing protein [Candidatus Bathycorpusculum sp.]|uniref:InlB B-repeat-containing protein n=1 Tax=Candidatus Bathycorpusculum sp. TaxID=2994959 RepID=UPI0028303615|nr:InlB B-repeat-containing protein [Candidatus Termitimicrobium sp.]MCL2686290.1 InlB B-repeat-containing protein [Candidatus Termitimicrobium sp.]